MSNDARQKNYKHRGLDSEELRKRREDLNINLRKQKREEQVKPQRAFRLQDLHCDFSYSNDEI